MTFIHIVLVKLNDDVKSQDEKFEKFNAACQGLKDLEGVKPYIKEMYWKKPDNTQRLRGYDWGLYSVFENKENYEKYAVHSQHREFVNDWIATHTTDILAFDWVI